MADLHALKDGLIVTAFWEARPDEVDAVQAIVRQFLPQAQREPGVVLVPGQRPTSDAVSGTINMLCSDRYTDMGEGATYQSTFLDVGPWKAAP